MKALSLWLKKEKSQGHLKRDIAESFGISPSYLSMLISGKRMPSIKLLRLISEKTGIKTNRLLMD